ncbi:MAG TPA: hypothetical protein VFX68_01705 [Sulfuricurvum sp.]|nr:hypothetical protein [Sulfuricurvum sp.]
MKLSNLTLTNPYRELDPIFYDEVHPTPLKNPILVNLNTRGADLLGLNPDTLEDKELESLLNSTLLLEGSKPLQGA